MMIFLYVLEYPPPRMHAMCLAVSKALQEVTAHSSQDPLTWQQASQRMMDMLHPDCDQEVIQTVLEIATRNHQDHGAQVTLVDIRSLTFDEGES